MKDKDKMKKYVVAAFYQFATLDDYIDLKAPLLAFCVAHKIKGTILLAEEGVNGTIAGTRADIDAVLAYLRADVRLADLEHKESYNDELPFLRMKIKLKKEIVTMGLEKIDPNKAVGTYVKAEDWNALLADPEVLLIDTRNDYEVDIGLFKGAINPKTQTFREFPDYVDQHFDPKKHKKVAMYCTGGIRCEKASSLMIEKGYEQVFHLQGGILKYLETIKPEDSLWQGECFVFDQRVAVDHALNKGSYEQCYNCRYPLSAEDLSSEFYAEGVSCPRCYAELTEDRRARVEERQHQVELAQQRHQTHIGANQTKPA